MSQNTQPFPFLVEKVLLKGTLTARTGLHIGGSEVGLTVGGADNVVVRNPSDGRPYVPGSSLKGKMRSLLERAGFARECRIENRNGTWTAPPCQCARLDCLVCQLFGVAADTDRPYVPGEKWSTVGRLIVRDGFLKNAEELEAWQSRLDVPFGEIKTEVAIDRLTSRANPRNFERVPAGAVFGVEMVVDVREGDSRDALLGLLLTGLRLVAADFLGGHGTRGYGAVEVRVAEVSVLDVRRIREGGAAEWTACSEIAGQPLPWTAS